MFRLLPTLSSPTLGRYGVYRFVGVLLVLLMIWMAQPASAGESCTWGTDCPHDCWNNTAGTGTNEDCGGTNAGLTCAGPGCSALRGGNGIPIRTSAVGGVGAILFDEDYEDTDYQNYTNTGDGWNASSAWRGDLNAFNDKYGVPSFDCNWKNGFPAAAQCTGSGAPYPCCTGSGVGATCPVYGPTCSGASCIGNGNPSPCCTAPGVGATCSCWADEWTLNTEHMPPVSGSDSKQGPCIDIFGDGENFNDEAAALGIPDCPGNDGLSGTADDDVSCLADDGVFDGHQAIRYRNAASGGGFSGTGGIWGGVDITGSTTVAVTFAAAYPDNQATSNIHANPWKHEEWRNNSDNGGEYWCTGGDQGSVFPFGGILFFGNGVGGLSAANATAAAASQGAWDGSNPKIGSVTAVDIAIHFETGNFVQATNWPFGKWGCVQCKLSGMRTSSMRIEKWLNGIKVMDVKLDGTNTFDRNFNHISFENYANVGAVLSLGASGINQLSSRGQDNFVVTNGNPVSCAEIGSSGGSSPAPTPNKGGSVRGSFRSAFLDDPFGWWLAYAYDVTRP